MLVVQPCAQTPNATYPLYPLAGSNTTVSDVFISVFVDNADRILDDFYVAVFTAASESIDPTRAHIRGNVRADADSETRTDLL